MSGVSRPDTLIYFGARHHRRDVEANLAAAGVRMVWTESLADVGRFMADGTPPVMVDLARGVMTLHAVRELRTDEVAPALFAVVDRSRPDLTTEAVIAGVADVFTHPLDAQMVVRALSREAALQAAIASGTQPDAFVSGDLYAQAPTMQAVTALVERAARSDGGFAVRGEPGAGRQLTARALHAARRATGEFVVVDCAGVEPPLIEVVLFGTVGPTRGSSRRPERVRASSAIGRARGGTLFIQHLPEISTRAQARLLRVLRDGEACLDESGETVRLDVRTVAALDHDTDQALADGRLRADLFSRLSGTIIDLPPLRERREDMAPFANFFVRQICASRAVPPKVISRPALSLITALPWRGNAAELRTMLVSVVESLPAGRAIGLDDVLAHVSLDGGSARGDQGLTLRAACARFEREYIRAALVRSGGRMGETAKALGLQRTNLYRKLRALKVDRPGRR